MIPAELLKPGVRLPGSIYDRNGAILIERGVELTLAHIMLMESLDPQDIMGGPDWPADMLPPRRESPADPAIDQDDDETDDDEGCRQPELIDVDALRAGMRLAQDLFDPSGILLLAAGMRITPRFLTLLKKREIKVLRIGETPRPRAEEKVLEPVIQVGSPHEKRIVEMDGLLDDELRMAPRIHPVRAWRRPRLPITELREEAARGLERHAAVSASIADATETLLVGGRISARNLGGQIKTFVDMVTLDFDVLPLVVSMQRTEDEYLFDHCVNVAMISLAIGAQLGLNQEQLMEVGLGGLLQDVGMLRVPGNIRLAPRALTPDERVEIDRHPLHTIEMLERVPGLPASTRLIGYQVHERGDGSGYPRGSRSGRLHPLSSIVAVADSFAAMTRPRPHRQALMPYEAARKILLEGNAQRFDITVVRAFLDTLSLFPIGSVVELHNGMFAKVLRANADQHTRPVIEMLGHEGHSTGEVIDLAKEPSLTVVRAHAYPPEKTQTTRGMPAMHGAASGLD